MLKVLFSFCANGSCGGRILAPDGRRLRLLGMWVHHDEQIAVRAEATSLRVFRHIYRRCRSSHCVAELRHAGIDHEEPKVRFLSDAFTATRHYQSLGAKHSEQAGVATQPLFSQQYCTSYKRERLQRHTKSHFDSLTLGGLYDIEGQTQSSLVQSHGSLAGINNMPCPFNYLHTIHFQIRRHTFG
jgi:hypothetical protein